MEEKTLDDKLDNLDKFLKDYQEKFHLDKIRVLDPDIEFTIGQIKKMDPEDIEQKLLEWGLYCSAIQVRINELKARLTWVDDNYKRYTGIHQQEISREYGFTAEDRKLLLLENDTYADKLYRMRTVIKVELAQLEYIPNDVHFLMKVAQNISEGKRRERGNYRN